MGEDQLEGSELRTLIEELRVHKAELELQNEELRRAHESAALAHERYLTLFHDAPVGYLSLDESGTIHEANRTFATMLEAELDEIIEKPLAGWLCEADRQLFLGRVRPFFKQPQGKQLDLWFQRKSGSTFAARLETSTVDSFVHKKRRSTVSPLLLVTVSETTEQWALEDALRAAERQKSLILNSMTEMVAFHDCDLRVQWANLAAARSIASDPESMKGHHCYELWAGDSEPCQGCPVIAARDNKSPQKAERVTPDGRCWSIRAYPAMDETGEVIGITEFGWETTDQFRALDEKERLEEQLAQAQKLEAVGRLAGGVAHDFNNMLTLVYGNLDIAESMLPTESPVTPLLHEIYEAAESSAALTRQLLAFSRKQRMVPKALDFGSIVSGLERMLRRLIGEDIDLVVQNSDRSLTVVADPGQLEQVIVNLAVNARDAMPEGGKLTLSTEVAHLSEADTKHIPGLEPGAHARLRITDTGEGMSEATRQHIFEPFFTTKAADRGTGLGLSTVYGIVKQHGGHITVDSTPDVGTTFDVYFTLHDDDLALDEGKKRSLSPPSRSGTILLVEDDSQVRRTAKLTLERKGYDVIATTNGKEALERAQKLKGKLDLLLTDVVMPEMNGQELVKKLKEYFTWLPVLYTSGYTNDIVSREQIEDTGGSFLEKPYTPQDLTRAVYRLLTQQS